jgi:hypothetical protein
MTKSKGAQMIVKPSAEGVMASAAAAAKRGPPPLHLWNPPFCGDIDMRIAKDGTWFHEGTPIGRMPLVKLFSSILKLEGGKYFLVTPVEKVGIIVDDAPMVAVDFEVNGAGQDQTLKFFTKTDDEVIASEQNRIRIVQDENTKEPAPYVHIRDGLEALIDRKSFYRLIELGCHAPYEGASWFGLWSSGCFFPVIPSNELL